MNAGDQSMASDRRRGSYRICYTGTFERDYPRNALVIRALRDAGAHVEISHVPVFERRRDKSGLTILGIASLAIRLAIAYVYLIPDLALRMLRCRAIAFGYIGQLDVLVLAPVARLMGRRVLFNPLVTLTDTLVEDRGFVSRRNPLARFIWLIDWCSLSLSHLVLVDTEENGRYLRQRFGLPMSKIAVVPVGADQEIFYPRADADTPPEDAVRILFFGKFVPLHGIETVIRAAALVAQSDSRFHFELIGRGQDYGAARALARELNVENITWIEWVSFDELGDRLCRADIALGIFGTGAKAGRVVPNKVHQSIAAGVATITRDSGAARALLRDREDALLVPAGNAEALASAILSLRDAERRHRLGEAGFAAWSRKASRDALANRSREVLRRLRHGD